MDALVEVESDGNVKEAEVGREAEHELGFERSGESEEHRTRLLHVAVIS